MRVQKAAASLSEIQTVFLAPPLFRARVNGTVLASGVWMNKSVDQEEFLHLLQKHFGFEKFRKGQLPILTTLARGRDVVGVLPTGSGKSLCYQIPMLSGEGVVIVVSPLIALMEDQTQALKARGIAAYCLHGNQSRQEKLTAFQEMEEKDSYLLYLSPERVQRPGFLKWLKKRKVQLIAIDEAHCVSQWGHDFRPDYLRLKLFKENLPDTPVLAMTATATPMVLDDIENGLLLNEPERHVYGFYRPNLYYQAQACQDDEEKFSWVRQALNQFPEGRILIYCGTRKKTEALAEHLMLQYSGVGFYHAGMGKEERKTIQERYQLGELRILVATNAFGMGIDHPDVRLVIHFQMPANLESLYQEMGRAGRDEKSSTCLLLHSRKDYGLQVYFIQQSEASRQVTSRRWLALESIQHYADGGECRHAEILTYFKDRDRIDNCGHCDVCLPNSSRKIRAPEVEEGFTKRVLTKTKRKKSKKAELRKESLVTDEQKARWDLLREWRKQYAQSQDMPAFMVFSDKTLIDLCHKSPESLTEMEEVHGLGPKKIEWFGQDLLLAMRD